MYRIPSCAALLFAALATGADCTLPTTLDQH